MKKLLLSIVAMFMAIGMNATVVETNASSGFTGDENGYTATINGYKISYLKHESSTNLIAPSADHIRVYKNAMLVIEAVDGSAITSLEITCTGADKCADLTVEGGKATADGKLISWSGSTTKFEGVAADGQVRIVSIKINEGTTTPEDFTPAGTGEGTVESPYDVTRAVDIILHDKNTTKEVYVKGSIAKVTEISLSYGNATYDITDGSAATPLTVFRGYALGGQKFTSEDEIQDGDEVIVCGKLVNYNGTPEVAQGNSIYSLNGKTYEKPNYEATGDGSEANPYTVDDIVGLDILESDGNKYWVKGFIVGCASSATALAEGEKIGDTNIALGMTANATTFIPAALPAGDLRSILGVATNPQNVGYEVMVYGSLEKYFSVAGIKSVTDYKWVNGEPVKPEGNAIYYVDINPGNEDVMFEGENPWEYAAFDLEEYAETSVEVGQLTNDGYVFYGNIDGTIGFYYGLLYSPFFDLNDYTGVYAEWEESCTGFGDDETVMSCTAVEMYYYLNDSYSDDEGQYSFFAPETRAADNGVMTKCRIDVPDDYEGMRDRVYVSFDYFSYPEDDEYPAWCGKWTIKSFGLYGSKDGDSIERIEPITVKDMQVYDLAGRKQTTLHKGLNIVNGKKIVVK